MEEKDHPWIGLDAIILNENKTKILLVYRHKDPYKGQWCLISSFMKWGETISEGVIRAVKKETGLNSKIIKFIGKPYDKLGAHPTKTMVCLPYYCEIINGELKAEEGSEIKWFSLEEVKDMDLAFDHKQMLIDEKLI